MTSAIVPEAVEQYIGSLAPSATALQEEVARDGRARGIPIVLEPVGRLLYVLAAAIGARRILEVGTAVGYSTLWLGRALPADGLLIGIERDPDRAAEARTNLARADLAGRASVMVGDAERLVWKVAGPFDLIFQDGDKLLYEPLHERLVALLKPRGLLVTDNVLWRGEVVPRYVDRPAKPPETTAAIAAYNRRIAADPRLTTIILPVGDGVAISLRHPDPAIAAGDAS